MAAIAARSASRGEPRAADWADEAEHGALLAAVIDNRAGEVGLAVLDAGGAALHLAQHVETTRTFSRTLGQLAQYNPERLLVVAEAQEYGIAKASQPLFEQVMPVPRGFWDDSTGFVKLTTYATAEARAALEAGMLQSLAGGYLAYAAAGALLRYLEQPDSGLVLTAGSLAVQHMGSDTHMHIDPATAQALELVQPIRVGTCSAKLSGMSLFKVLDRTKTKCGARLLRANLLQPLRDIPTLNARYDAVEELVAGGEMAFNVTACLAKLPKDLDKMCGGLCMRPARTESGIQRRIAALILLHEAMAVLPPLADALQGARCELLQAVGAACGHAAFGELQELLQSSLEEDVQSNKNTFLNRTQQCFALKSGVDGFLDVARQTFCRVTEQVHELASRLQQQHGLPNMRCNYANKKGFYFVLGVASGGGSGRGGRGGRGTGRQKHPRDLEEDGEDEHSQLPQQSAQPTSSTAGGAASSAWGTAAGRDGRGGTTGRGGSSQQLRIPPGFSVLQHNGRTAHVTTCELNALNARLRDASNDCLVLTEQVLEGLCQKIVTAYMPLLHRLVDSLALLDMLAGFAAVASGTDAGGDSRQFVRPVLTEAGPLAFVEARHPVLECLDSAPFQPNDTYLALSSSFHIITGPNMAGKSTYLRQVALNVVTAQVGAFVPASFASLTPCDRLLSRIGTGDSLETCSSSFMVEMQDAAYILAQATPRSLVLIDELGRATSTADGVGLAWAISEALIEVGAPTLFATHFMQLTELAALYPAAKAWHFDVDASRNRLDFSWRLRPGTSEAGHYGLALARTVGFPPDVMQAAEEVVAVLDASDERRVAAYATPDAAELEAVYDIVHKLACVAQSYAAGSSGGEAGSSGGAGGDLRALQKQLRHLKLEAGQALAAARAPPEEPLGA